MIRICLIAVLMTACGHSSPPTTSEAGALSLTVDLYVIRDGQRVLVHEHDEVRSGEVLEVEVTPSSKAFLYVMQQHPDGSLDLLAPDEGDVAFSAGETVRLPDPNADYELYLDDVVGPEIILVMASPRPIDQLDVDAGDVIIEARAEAAAPPVDAGAAPMAEVDAGVAPQPAIDAGAEPAPAKVVKVKRKKTRQKAVGGTTSDDEGSISLNPRGVRKRPKRVEVQADQAGVIIYPYVVDHR